MKKNILQFIGSFHTGGSERQAVQLVHLLKEAGKFNVFLATLNREGALLEEVAGLRFNQIPEFPLISFYDLNFAKQIKNCVKFLRENKIEIVHTHDFYTNIFGITAAKLAGVKVKIASKRETGGMRSNLQKTIEKRIFGWADAVAVNSKAVEKYLIDEGISREKLELIYNGLDLERLQPKLTDRKQILEKLGLPTDENIKFITLVANLRHDVKNQPMFLRAAQKVSAKFPNAHFVLAGEGELREGLENLARELKIVGNTHFIGRCEIVPELLSASFSGTLTSFHEGFSNSILEYMAAKLPVVATNVGGASEAIVENETGFLVKSDDDETFANCLIALLEDETKARKFGENGAKIVAEKFSVAAQLKNVSELYERKSNER